MKAGFKVAAALSVVLGPWATPAMAQPGSAGTAAAGTLVVKALTEKKVERCRRDRPSGAWRPSPPSPRPRPPPVR